MTLYWQKISLRDRESHERQGIHRMGQGIVPLFTKPRKRCSCWLPKIQKRRRKGNVLLGALPCPALPRPDLSSLLRGRSAHYDHLSLDVSSVQAERASLGMHPKLCACENWNSAQDGDSSPLKNDTRSLQESRQELRINLPTYILYGIACRQSWHCKFWNLQSCRGS